MTPRRFTVTESREAMLVSADNLVEVREWCKQIASEVVTPHPEGYIGRYLVTDGQLWWHIAADEFERQSARWEEEAT